MRLTVWSAEIDLVGLDDAGHRGLPVGHLCRDLSSEVLGDRVDDAEQLADLVRLDTFF